MLLTRIITALILAPAVLAAVLWLPLDYLAVVLWAITAAGCYEWAALVGLRTVPGKLAYVALFAGLAYLSYALVETHTSVLALGCGIWVLAMVAVIRFPSGQGVFKNRAFIAVLGMLLLVPAWLALLVIRRAPDGEWWLVWTLFLAWGADIGAYFAGRAFGRRKLAVAVSPGKTWEGALGGFAFAGVVCAYGAYLLTPAWLAWLPVMALLIVISVFGDLFESVLKRATGIKDSGTLLPGHGGVLDRIDSLLAVLPFCALILTYGTLWN